MKKVISPRCQFEDDVDDLVSCVCSNSILVILR